MSSAESVGFGVVLGVDGESVLDERLGVRDGCEMDGVLVVGFVGSKDPGIFEVGTVVK
eukprot:CAMPEP_0168806104 /NCGR_PEP_ID=MMETSP0726-20121227/1373_1 /TAXON_ID=265536 /ORGANISM="Amphiprora sp., Strain CCMP467" /LENGTH=57 /DNA_ID=CAMNT_0008857997 /DNA_START=37 /DNA_END=210 /DNA_ORIENTATION=+